MPHEYLQYSNECRILALDDLAEAGSPRISDSLGICLPPGIVVELRTLCGTASWFASAGAGAAVGVVSAFFSFGGWWDVSKLAGEVRDPGRTLPRALLLGLLAVTAVYIVVSAVFLYLVPLDKVTSDQTFVAQAGEVLFGPTGGVVFAAIVIICLVGSLSALIIFAPRVYYAMANDGLFLKAVARTHPRFGTPANAIAIQGSIASLLVCSAILNRSSLTPYSLSFSF